MTIEMKFQNPFLTSNFIWVIFPLENDIKDNITNGESLALGFYFFIKKRNINKSSINMTGNNKETSHETGNK